MHTSYSLVVIHMSGCNDRSCHGCEAPRERGSYLTIDGKITMVKGLEEAFRPYLETATPPDDIDFSLIARTVRERTTLVNVTNGALLRAIRDDYARRLQM